MRDLFGESAISGLNSADDFLTTDEELALIGQIDALELSPFRFQGWTGKRLTHSFGLHYDFDHHKLAAAEPMPSWLTGVRTRAERFAGLSPGTLRQALLIRYDPGAGIGWHRDRPHFEHVVGISMGGGASMRFRRRRGAQFDRISIPLPPRGIYHLAGEARHQWEHSIAPLTKTRWSITLRSLSERGRILV